MCVPFMHNVTKTAHLFILIWILFMKKIYIEFHANIIFHMTITKGKLKSFPPNTHTPGSKPGLERRKPPKKRACIPNSMVLKSTRN